MKIRSKRYVHKESIQSKKNWLSKTLKENRFKPETLDQNSDILNYKSYGILNSSSQIEEANKTLRKELENYNSFWHNDTTKRFRRDRELEYQKIASKIWNLLHSKESTEPDYSVEKICDELNISKHTAMTILRKWHKLKLIVKRRVGYNYYDRRINFYIKVIKDQLPYVLYTNFRQKKKVSSGDSKNEK
ncbi:MarR family transcriptional regulator [Leptospira wolffii]|nr:MarR family transcriptional regulator [Leptospira wolffii]